MCDDSASFSEMYSRDEAECSTVVETVDDHLSWILNIKSFTVVLSVKQRKAALKGGGLFVITVTRMLHNHAGEFDLKEEDEEVVEECEDGLRP